MFVLPVLFIILLAAYYVAVAKNNFKASIAIQAAAFTLLLASAWLRLPNPHSLVVTIAAPILALIAGFANTFAVISLYDLKDRFPNAVIPKTMFYACFLFLFAPFAFVALNPQPQTATMFTGLLIHTLGCITCGAWRFREPLKRGWKANKFWYDVSPNA